MENQKHFCTCDDYDCKLNPNNGSRGCDLCIKSFVDFFLKNKE